MYVRYHVIVYGDNFYPSSIIKKLDTEFICDEGLITNKGDLKSDNGNDFYDYGILFLFHKDEFSKEYPDPEYELSFVEFFEKNYDLLLKAGADEFTIFLDVYFADQCNFEIFDKEMLKRLAKYNVSLPISVYAVKNNVIPKRGEGLKRIDELK